MNDRFKFRTPIYGPDREFKDLIYWNAEEGAPAISGRGGCVFKDPEQSTGLKDKNGRLIYSGDIVEHDTAAGPKRWPVLFKDGCFVLPYESGNAWLGKVIQNCPYSSGVVVVGNIHDNAYLLEGGNEQAKI